MLRARAVWRLFSAAEAPSTHFSIGKSYSFSEGLVRRAQVGETEGNEVAVMRVKGRTYAVGNKCPHSGGPLHTGYLDRFTLLSPSNLSAFDIRTGEAQLGPAVKALKSFQTYERDGEVFVEVPHQDLETVTDPTDAQTYTTRNPANTDHYLIIGSGAGAFSTAETLRKAGFEGAITMLTRESQLPYDRTKFSKDFTLDIAKIDLQPASFYEKLQIDVRFDSKVTEVIPSDNKVKTADGKTYTYDKLCVATGSKAKLSPTNTMFAAKYKNMLTFGSAADYAKAQVFVEAANDVIILGSSTLGIEAAVAIKTKWPAKSVTIFDPFMYPLGRSFGPEIAEYLLQAIRRLGVVVHDNLGVDHLRNTGDMLTRVLSENRSLPCQALLLCTGTEPITEFMPKAMLNEDQSLTVDSYFRTKHPNIFAVGDIARVYSLFTGGHERCGNWKTAIDHGRAAGLSMAGIGVPYSATTAYSLKVPPLTADFAGYSYGADTFHTQYQWKNGDFQTPTITLFFRGYRAVGVASTNIPNASAIFRIALERGILPGSHTLLDKAFDFESVRARSMASSLCDSPLASLYN